MNRFTKCFIAILGVILILLFVYNVSVYFTGEEKTQVAVEGKIENIVSVKGYVVRNEKILVPDNGKIISSLYTNGERVAAGSLVASVYDTDVDYETRIRLNEINSKIEKLSSLSGQKVSQDSVSNSDSKIRESVDRIISSSHRQGGYNIREARDEFEDAVTLKTAANNEETKAALSELNAEKKQIEEQIGSEKQNVYTDESGLYFTVFDGYEGVFDYNNTDKITVSSLKEAENLDAKPSSGTCIKIADNFNWYFAAAADTKKLSAVKPGNKVYLRFGSGENETVPAVVSHVSKDDGGKSVIVLSGDTYNEVLYTSNGFDADIILDSSSGLKISKSAVKVENGKKGVYIIKKGVKRFREVNILASDDEYVIIKRDLSTDVPHLALYDEVVVG